jgi:hypothetical protein
MKTAKEILESKIIEWRDGKPIETLDTSYALIQERYVEIIEAMEAYAEQYKPKWMPISLTTLPEIGQPVILWDIEYNTYLASKLHESNEFEDSNYEWESHFNPPYPLNAYQFWQPIANK